VESGMLHLTLLFLGDLPENRIQLLGASLEELLRPFPCFETPLQGLGCFGEKRNPAVLYCRAPAGERLTQLAELTFRTVAHPDFPIPGKPFRPHVTLARLRELRYPGRVMALVEKYRDTFFQTLKANEVILYESLATPAGHRYSPLLIIPLADLSGTPEAAGNL